MGCSSFSTRMTVALAGRIVLSLLVLAGTVGCEGSESSSPASSGPDPVPDVALTEVTEDAGLDAFRHDDGGFGRKWMPETVGGGGAFIDYDGDDWPDVLLVGGGNFPGRDRRDIQSLWLFRNDGDGTFTEVTEQTGLAEIEAYGQGLTVGDYDGDGDQDFFLSTLGRNRLFENRDGRFTEVTERAGLGEEELWSTSAVFFDPDRDGDLDLFVTTYVDWSPEKDVYCSIDGEKAYCTPERYEGVPSRFYENTGDGTFEERTREAGLWPPFDSSREKAFGVTELDFNRDGWPDLVVASDTEQDILYVNDGDGTFTENGRRMGVAYSEHGDARAGMGVEVGVVDSTGRPSIFVANFSEEMIGVYRYDGRGSFVDRAAISRIGHPSLTTLAFGLSLFDVDLDGDLDLFAANGHVQPRIERVSSTSGYRQRSQLFLNRGNGRFEEYDPPRGSSLRERWVARGAFTGDYDRDGDPDLLVTENGGPVHLLRNDGASGRYLRVYPEGRQSNRSGLGARVSVYRDGYRQERRIRGGASFLSQSEQVATFGVGAVETVDSVTVHWPSGRVDRFGEVRTDREIRIVEGGSSLQPVPRAGPRSVASR